MRRPYNLSEFDCARLRIAAAALALGALLGMTRIGEAREAKPGLALNELRRAPGLPAFPFGGVGPIAPIRVTADAAVTLPSDPDALRAWTFGPDANAAVPASDRPTGSPSWSQWGHFASPRARVTLTPMAGLANDALQTYAVRFGEGITLGLANRSDRALPIRVTLRLPRGVYTVERLTLSPAPTDKTGSADAVTHDLPAAQAAPPDPTSDPASASGPFPTADARLERLESRFLAQAGAVVKTGVLEPGQICLYRCVDQSRAARLALLDLDAQLRTLAASAPGPARRLRTLLHEGDAYLGALASGGSGGARRLNSVHHLLLLVGAAQSRHRNYQARHAVGAEAGAAVMGALERATDALAETSAVLLGLVPQISIATAPAAPPAAVGPSPASGAHTAGLPAPADSRAAITVALTNAGTQSVTMVKLGLDSSALPSGSRSDPADPAFFGTLRPGQSVRAVFHLHCPVSREFPRRLCVGDVSYFAASAPAHLRPRPW